MDTNGNTKELIKDLCSRLPYGVKVAFLNEDLTYHSEPKTLIGIECINNLNYSNLEDEDGNTTIVEFVKPYLFPLSSIDDEIRGELVGIKVSVYESGIVESSPRLIDFYNKYHLDYRGLIEKSLAIDATGLNIY